MEEEPEEQEDEGVGEEGGEEAEVEGEEGLEVGESESEEPGDDAGDSGESGGESDSGGEGASEGSESSDSGDGSNGGSDSGESGGENSGDSEVALSPKGKIVNGKVSKGDDYLYELKENEEGAEVVPDSVEANGMKVDASVLDVSVEGREVFVSTDYAIVGDEEVRVDVSRFGFVAPDEDSVFSVKIVSSTGEIIAEEEVEIFVEEEVEEEITEGIIGEEVVEREIRGIYGIKLNEPVIWTKEIAVFGEEMVIIEIPEEAEIVSIEEIDGVVDEEEPVSVEEGDLGEGEVETGEVEDEVEEEIETDEEGGIVEPEEIVEEEILDEEVALSPPGTKEFQYQIRERGTDKIFVEYSTPPVTMTYEEEIETGLVVTFSAPDIEMEGHEYEDVEVYVEIPEEFVDRADSARIYWVEEEQYVPIVSVGDGFIRWIVPHFSNQTFEIIFITAAEHLDDNRVFVEDVYEEVRERDDVWIEIPEEHYVRVWFEENLTSEKDITIYARSSENASVEVYEENGTELIADFGVIDGDMEYKIYLTELEGEQGVFDLLVKDGVVEFDILLILRQSIMLLI
ncbi:MAG: hypothetical protein ABIH92_04985 [Nanoarchaeota archaeon]